MNLHRKNLITFLIISALPVIYLELVQYLGGNEFSITKFFIRWVSVLIILIAAKGLNNFRKYWIFLIFAILAILYLLIYPSTIIAWLVTIITLTESISLAEIFSREQNRYKQILIYSLVLLSTLTLLFYFYQREERFSNEELYLLLQWGVFAIFWIILAFCSYAISRMRIIKRSNHPVMKSWAFILINLIITLSALVLIIIQYQHSFFPEEFQLFHDGIIAEPFYCEPANDPPSKIYSSEEVYKKISKLIENNPNKQSPDYAFLALATGDDYWAQNFRESILIEATQGYFTEPANSVKYGQYLSALRAYFFPLVRNQFPELFTTKENGIIEDWFGRINQRAHEREWVDWLYAVAYQKKPEGPYENQEVGAGLLAILEVNNLSDSSLAQLNQNYLNQYVRGWVARFRNTDDAAVYQPVWLDNALLQSFYNLGSDNNNKRLSYDWLLYLSHPDGSPLTYNHINSALIADTAYQSAALLEDQVALWIAGQAADYLLATNMYLSARPGLETLIDLKSKPPNFESCLIFGDSGLPNQIGPISPDKIVLRDSWDNNATYLLANLRFTGWHRYKATNTITNIYQSGSIIVEKMFYDQLRGLPIGRSIFRDKRIPRENLNGLVIQRSGMSLIINILTGFGSDWAQDPPFYAQVIDFETSEKVDFAHTRLESWRDWNHDRRIYFHENGPIIISDEVSGPKYQKGAITWHAIGEYLQYGERDSIVNDITKSRVVYIPLNDGNSKFGKFENDTAGGIESYHYSDNGKISLITIILTEDWSNAEIVINQDKDDINIHIQNDEKMIIQSIATLE